MHKMNFQNVATISTLRQMAERLPITRPGLCEIDGFPEHKYAKFEGMKFLNITTEFINKVASEYMIMFSHLFAYRKEWLD